MKEKQPRTELTYSKRELEELMDRDPGLVTMTKQWQQIFKGEILFTEIPGWDLKAIFNL